MVEFRCYDPTADGTGGIHRWYYKEITPEIRASIDSALELMALEKNLDDHPNFKRLRGKCLGLAEIIIDIPIENNENDARTKRRKNRNRGKINIRILGPDNPPNSQFMLLTGFVKRGGPDYGPACHQAHNRNKGVDKNANKALPCYFPENKSPRGKNARQEIP